MTLSRQIFWRFFSPAPQKYLFKANTARDYITANGCDGGGTTTRKYDCRPYKTGNEEQCTFANPGQGTWHIDVRGYSNVTGLTLNVKAN
jgi:hypothetical protein